MDGETRPITTMVELHDLGRVTISPAVLARIVERAALGVPGVAALSPRHPRFDRLRGGSGLLPGGVRVGVSGETVSADIAIVATSGTNILELGQRIQHEVGEALKRMVGMEPGAINVYVDDVC